MCGILKHFLLMPQWLNCRVIFAWSRVSNNNRHNLTFNRIYFLLHRLYVAFVLVSELVVNYWVLIPHTSVWFTWVSDSTGFALFLVLLCWCYQKFSDDIFNLCYLYKLELWCHYKFVTTTMCFVSDCDYLSSNLFMW